MRRKIEIGDNARVYRKIMRYFYTEYEKMRFQHFLGGKKSKLMREMDTMGLTFSLVREAMDYRGCYETVTGLRIAELLRPINSRIVTVIRYTWNGHERVLGEPYDWNVRNISDSHLFRL